MNKLPIDILKLIWKEVIVRYPTKEETWYNNINYICIDKLHTKILLVVLYSIKKDLPTIVTILTNIINEDIYSYRKSFQFPGLHNIENSNFKIIFEQEQTKNNIGKGKYSVISLEDDNIFIKKEEVILSNFLIGSFYMKDGFVRFLLHKSGGITIDCILINYRKIYNEMKFIFSEDIMIGIKCENGILELIKK